LESLGFRLVDDLSVVRALGVALSLVHFIRCCCCLKL
jgi:hypothetical protein